MKVMYEKSDRTRITAAYLNKDKDFKGEILKGISLFLQFSVDYPAKIFALWERIW